MPEDSPPTFIVIRTPPPAPELSPYDRALELVGMVHELVSKATTRFHLKDRLDRATTALVFELGRAAAAAPSARWRHYRTAQDQAAVAGTVLDILVAQKAAPELELARARAAVRDLIGDLAPRTNG